MFWLNIKDKSWERKNPTRTKDGENDESVNEL